MKWYVVSAFSGCEEQVSKTLQERIDQHEDKNLFGQIIVPTEMVVEMRSGKRRIIKRKFFPGYVLVEMDLNDNTWHLVRSTPQVMGFIGGDSPEDPPKPLSDKEAKDILSRMEQGQDEPRPRSMLEPGEVVRIVDGPFRDFSATVETVNYEKSRLRVAVSILGRSTSLELELMQVEKT